MTDRPFDPGIHDDLAGWITDLVDDGWEDNAGDRAAEGDVIDPAWDQDEHRRLFDTDSDPAASDSDADAGLWSPNGPDATAGDAEYEVGDSLAELPSISLADLDPSIADDPLPPADQGLTSVAVLTAVAGEFAGASVEPASVHEALDRLGIPDAYLGVDARSAAQVLQSIGVDALVSHGSVEELADRLAVGDRVALAGADGSRHPVLDIDFKGGRLIVDTATGPRTVDLPSFVEAWSGTAQEMVLATDSVGVQQVIVPVALEVARSSNRT